jgi:hypothetical protein
MVFVVRLILAKGTVTLLSDNRVRLVDGEVKRGCEVGIFPGLSLFYMKIATIVVWHGPNGDGYGNNNEYTSGQNVPPMEFFHTII